MSKDGRGSIYQDLHTRQLSKQETDNQNSASKILGLLWDCIAPDSVLDVGCGLGTWLKTALDLGARDVCGIEGDWLDKSQLRVNPEKVLTLDLEKGFQLNRRFELVICLEVAEHLHESSAERFIDSLTAHSDLVLFSAAIPFQGGHHHVNERFLDYWVELFFKSRFRPADFIRPQIWTDPSILWWLKQNIVLMVHERVLDSNEMLRKAVATSRPLSMVHPDVYLSRMQNAAVAIMERDELYKILSQEGVFRSTKMTDGRMRISRQSD